MRKLFGNPLQRPWAWGPARGLRFQLVLAGGLALVAGVLATAGLAGWWVMQAPQPLPPRALAAAGLLTLVLLLVLWALFARVSRLLQPLPALVQAVDRLAQGGAGSAPCRPPHGGDELAQLGHGVGRLAQALAARQAELLAARDAAERAAQAKSQFLSVMSHELRTPLNAMLGMAELLANTRLDSRQQRYVQQVRRAGRMLAGLISDVLDLGHIEAGKLRPTLAPFRLRDLVDESVAMFAEEARARGLGLSRVVDEALPDRVHGDTLRTRQILANLLSNALKFTEHGAVVVQVVPAAAGTGVRFSVADTGPGIAPALVPHLYEAFRQGDGSSTRRFGGAGMGLAIAQQLCEALGGRIDLHSLPGRGSTFWFELPLPPAPPGPPVPPGAVPPAAAPGPSPGLPAPRALEVLLIDDSAATRDQVQHSLAGSGLRLDIGLDGLDGIARLRERAYDVLLLDWQLPGIDGPAVLALLRALEAQTGRPRTHVIAVTAHAAPGDRETCLAAGVDDYLAKPFSGDALRARLAGLAGLAAPAGQPGAVVPSSAAPTAASRSGSASGLLR